jgi:hypothetical protein
MLKGLPRSCEAAHVSLGYELSANLLSLCLLLFRDGLPGDGNLGATRHSKSVRFVGVDVELCRVTLSSANRYLRQRTATVCITHNEVDSITVSQPKACRAVWAEVQVTGGYYGPFVQVEDSDGAFESNSCATCQVSGVTNRCIDPQSSVVACSKFDLCLRARRPDDSNFVDRSRGPHYTYLLFSRELPRLRDLSQRGEFLVRPKQAQEILSRYVQVARRNRYPYINRIFHNSFDRATAAR